MRKGLKNTLLTVGPASMAVAAFGGLLYAEDRQDKNRIARDNRDTKIVEIAGADLLSR